MTVTFDYLIEHAPAFTQLLAKKQVQKLKENTELDTEVLFEALDTLAMSILEYKKYLLEEISHYGYEDDEVFKIKFIYKERNITSYNPTVKEVNEKLIKIADLDTIVKLKPQLDKLYASEDKDVVAFMKSYNNVSKAVLYDVDYLVETLEEYHR